MIPLPVKPWPNATQVDVSSRKLNVRSTVLAKRTHKFTSKLSIKPIQMLSRARCESAFKVKEQNLRSVVLGRQTVKNLR